MLLILAFKNASVSIVSSGSGSSKSQFITEFANAPLPIVSVFLGSDMLSIVAL